MKTNNVGLLIQVELITLLMIFLIISIFISELIVIVELSAAATLLAMSYNNHKLFSRKNMTALYLFTGIVFLVMSIIDYIEVL